MFSLAFALFAAMHAALAVLLAKTALVRRSTQLGLAVLVAAGLVYDNAIVAAGRLIGHGDVLLALNYPRFVAHALFTPLLIITAVGLARSAGAPWARGRVVHALFCGLATALIGYGLFVEVAGLKLVAATEGDALRYSAAQSSVPVPAVVTILVLIAVGLALWRRGGVWTAAGAAAMFVVSAVPATPMAVANLGEVVLLAGIALTAYRPGRSVRPASMPV